MTRLIEWGGEPFAMLIESKVNGIYLGPPLVFDAEDNLIEGHEVAAALAAAGFVPGGAWKAAEARAGRDVFIWSAEAPGGTRVQHPVLVNRTVADLAEIDQRVARISEVLGVPIGPGGHERDVPGDPAPESA